MEVIMPANHSTEERLMAAVAHASVIVFGTGILVGVIIWITQKEKNPYASWQGLQATVYQLIGMIVVMALWVLWGIFYAITFIPIMQYPEIYSDAPPTIFWVGTASMVIPLFVMFIWMLYGLWGAFKTFRGQDFRYVIIGSLISHWVVCCSPS
jgi:uncharacterized Tic20 family protein